MVAGASRGRGRADGRGERRGERGGAEAAAANEARGRSRGRRVDEAGRTAAGDVAAGEAAVGERDEPPWVRLPVGREGSTLRWTAAVERRRGHRGPLGHCWNH